MPKKLLSGEEEIDHLKAAISRVFGVTSAESAVFGADGQSRLSDVADRAPKQVTPLTHGLASSQVERLAAAALSDPNRHAAVRFPATMLPEAESELPGLRNSGVQAAQELRTGVPARQHLAKTTRSCKHLVRLAGRNLIAGLGFSMASLSVSSSALTMGEGVKRAAATYLDETDTFDETADRFEGTSPIALVVARAGEEGLPWVVLTRGRQIRRYAARPDTAVGRRGRTERDLSGISIQAALIFGMI